MGRARPAVGHVRLVPVPHLAVANFLGKQVGVMHGDLLIRGYQDNTVSVVATVRLALG
jgi:hypothetical protein